MSRRLASSKVNKGGTSLAEQAPPAYEMSSGGNSQPTYDTILPEASPPAEYRNAPKLIDNGRTQPSSSPYDVILIDNDLYD